MSKLSDLDIQSRLIPHLEGQFQSAQPVLFAGAGFSLGARSVSGRPVPGVNDLNKFLWELAFPDDFFEENSDLQDIFDAAVSRAKRKVVSLFEDCFRISPNSIENYHLEIIGMPWHAIYTLNVDTLIEEGLKKLGFASESHSALGGVSALMAPSKGTKVVHLNGVLDDVPDGVTFSRRQYSVRNSDPFFESLVRDLRHRSVVFIGTSLEERLLWQYMELRGSPPSGRSSRENRPRSYLITPELSKAKAYNLARFNIDWFAGRAADFSNAVINKLEAAKAAGRIHQDRVRSEFGRPKVRLVSEIYPTTSEASDYLFGAEPTWDDALASRIAERPSIQAIDKKIGEAITTRTQPNLVIVAGTAGSGKSSSMMMSALYWQSEGMTAAWVDRDALYDLRRLEKEILKIAGIRLIYIENADLLGRGLLVFCETLAELKPELTIVAEVRSAKLDRILGGKEPESIGAYEVSVPPLADEDIESLLDVLDGQNRLGSLKGMSRDEQAEVFRKECGRQLLVAMYKATQGKEFEDKVQEEFDELSDDQRIIYGIVAVAHANRFYVERDEIANAFGDEYQSWPQELDKIVRRKLVLVAGNQFRVRHREIANLVYQGLQKDGRILDAVRGLIKIAGSKTYPGMRRNERPARMLSRFINHGLLKEHVGIDQARVIYDEFESLLEGNHHFWLHRGALELGDGKFSRARTFLNQSKGIDGTDILVDVEMAYLDLREAVSDAAQGLIRVKEFDEAIATLEYIAENREDFRAHVTHIGASQTLAFCRLAPLDLQDKERRFKHWITRVNRVSSWQSNSYLADAHHALNRELLALAVPK